MKKNYFLLLISLFVFSAVKSQNCNFTVATNPGTTIVNFFPNQLFVQGPFHFAWNFGDGTTDTLIFPVHTYNSMGPYVACYDILDTNNNIICSSCDSIFFGTTLTCFFSYTNTGSTFTFTANGVNGQVGWDFGDGTTDTGLVVTHTFTSGGSFSVIMTDYNSSTHNIDCQFNQGVMVPGPSNCNFTATTQGSSATFFLNSMNAIASVVWDFGDGNVSTGLQATHFYSFNGIYNVCVTVTDTSGNSCTSCQNVAINVLTNNCYFTFVPDSMNPNGFIFTGSGAYPMSNLTWDFGDGSPTTTGSNTTHIYSAPGTYQVCMTEDTNGITVCQSCVYVTIHNTSSCNFTYSANNFNPLTIDFQATGNAPVAWDFGDGTTDTGIAVTHTYAGAGIYFVCMSVGVPGTTNFCQYCDVITVGSPTNFCTITYYPDPLNQNTFIFTSSSSSPNSMIMWDFGDNSVGTGQTVSHTYNSAGPFTVCVTERDSMQLVLCQSCVTVQANGTGTTGCQASFLATSLGLDAYFIDMSVSSSPTLSYAWDFGDGGTSNLEFPMHSYTLPGLYNVCLTISDSGCSDTYCSPMLIDTLNLVGPANGGCNAFYAFTQLSPFNVTVVNLSSGFNLSFDWDFGDGTHDSNPYPTHQYTSTGSYNLCLTVSDGNGCSSTYCDTISVDSLGHIFRTATAGFTLNVVSPAQLTGVKEVTADKSFSIYPNPFTSEIHVTMLTGSKNATDYRIFTIQGAEVLRGKLEGTNGTISTQTLSQGAYLLEITMNDGSRGFQRVIKN